MTQTRSYAQTANRMVRYMATVVIAGTLMIAALIVLSAKARAGGYDVYGGAAGTQTVHQCGWVPTERIDFLKNNPRNTLIVQRKLANLGYYRGALDGQNGPITKAAIRKFQAENGHQLVDGIVGIETSAGIAYNTHPSPWVRGCRRPYNSEVVLRYYPRW